MQNFLKLAAILLGATYVFSGVSKGSDIVTFANLLSSYGSTKLVFIAPIVTGLEIFLGFGLMLNLRTKFLAKSSFYFLCILTITFAFGYFVKNIDDCGCFGNILKINPYLSFLKNGIMLAASLLIWKNSNVEDKKQPIKFSIVVLFALITFTINAVEIKESNSLQVNKLNGKNLKNTFLKAYADGEQNTEKAFFIFSPTCSHCKSAAKELSKSKIKVVGLYPDVFSDSTLSIFKKEVKPNFEIYPIKTDSITKYTERFPTIFIVKNGTIAGVLNNYLYSE